MMLVLAMAAAYTAVGTNIGSVHCPTFCGTDASGKAHTFDLSTLPNKTFTLSDDQ